MALVENYKRVEMKDEPDIKRLEFTPNSKSRLREMFWIVVFIVVVLGYQLFERATEVGTSGGHSLTMASLLIFFVSTLFLSLVLGFLGFGTRDFYEINLGLAELQRGLQIGRKARRWRAFDLSDLVWVATQNRFSPASKYSRECWNYRVVLVTNKGRMLPVSNWESSLEKGYEKSCRIADEVATFSGIKRMSSQPVDDLCATVTSEGPQLQYVRKWKPPVKMIVRAFLGSVVLLVAVAYIFANDARLPIAALMSQIPFVVLIIVAFFTGGLSKD
jgi:hypothetical protein